MPRVIQETANVPDRAEVGRLRVVVVVDGLDDDVDLARADRDRQIDAPTDIIITLNNHKSQNRTLQHTVAS